MELTFEKDASLAFSASATRRSEWTHDPTDSFKRPYPSRRWED